MSTITLRKNNLLPVTRRSLSRPGSIFLLSGFGRDARSGQAAWLSELRFKPGLAGFGLPDLSGNWTGLDVDFCRAVAAAIFNDPTKVKFISLTAKDRFTALQSGEVDVLAHNTTWTISREAVQGLLFTGINYYDGQGFMVHNKLNISSALELSGASICVQQGTTSELNLADFFHSHQMQYESVTFVTADEALKAYDTGRCDAFTTDSSALYIERLKLANPEQNIVLPEIISKEPLGPVVRQGDDRWFNVVKWVNFAMLDAEEAGITSKNVDEKMTSDDPTARRLLGVEGNFGEISRPDEGLGLPFHQSGRQLR